MNSLFVVDVRHPAELMPGYRDTELLTSDGLFEHILSGDNRLVDFTLYCVFFIPAYFYRLSIKSTCWLYWPLAYIANDAKGETRPAVLFDKRCATPLAWFSFIVSGVSIIVFVVTNIHFTTFWPAMKVAFQLAEMEFLFDVDWGSQKPWVYFNLTSAVITFCLFLWAGQMRVELKHGDPEENFSHRVRWMNRLARVGRV